MKQEAKAVHIKIRPYTPEDCPALQQLFFDTVHTVNAKDYPEEALWAWAPGQADPYQWNDSFLEHITLVAEIEGQIAGFGDMDQSGYLDRLYVHRDRQGQGVATALCDALERMTEAETIVTHASLTAKPFFLGRGYVVKKEQQVMRKGILLTNFVMELRKKTL